MGGQDGRWAFRLAGNRRLGEVHATEEGLEAGSERRGSEVLFALTRDHPRDGQSGLVTLGAACG